LTYITKSVKIFFVGDKNLFHLDSPVKSGDDTVRDGLSMKKITTRETVAAAIKQLEEENKDVTARSIREKMGGGNLGKICDVIKELKEVDTIDETSNIALITSPKLDPYDSKFKGVVESLISNVQKLLNTEKQKYDNDLNNYIQELETSKLSITELVNENVTLKERLANTEDLVKSLNAKLEIQKETLSVTIAEKSAELSLTRDKLMESNSSAAYYKGMYEGGFRKEEITQTPKQVEAEKRVVKPAKGKKTTSK
jgi:hypothetical protein